MSVCTECGWAEPGYSCDGTSNSPGCKLKLMDLSETIAHTLGDDPTSDAAYDTITTAIEHHFGVHF